jgi:hypothetical protein
MTLQDSNPDKPRLSNFEVQEKAAEAQALLGNSVFVNAMDDTYSKAIGILLKAEVGSLTASAAHASMKAVQDIKAQLEEYIADHKMRQKYNKGDK